MRNPAPAEKDTVARRIVMPRHVWDQLEHLADALRTERQVEVTAADVALIALETGLGEVSRGARQATRPRKAASRKTKSGSQSRRRTNGDGEAVRLGADERAELEALLAGESSARGRQRTIALWLGAARRRIDTEALRALADTYGAYNVANFAQNMKKDGALFGERRASDGGRLGWRLTARGERAAAELREASLQTA